MFHKCSKKDTTATNKKKKEYFLFWGLFAFDMVLAWSVLNANKKEERPIHGWVWQSSKAFEVFLWPRCNPNWDQLGWAAPLQNIVFASVGDQWFAAVMNIRVSYSRRPHQNFFPGICSAWMLPGTRWTRCPARPCSSWKTSTSSTSPSTKSSTSRRTLLLVSLLSDPKKLHIEFVAHHHIQILHPIFKKEILQKIL